MKRKPLQVSLHALEPSVVELTVGDRVQLDRLTPSPRGYLAERHGRLLDQGVTTVALPPGQYFFQTLSDTHLRVVAGGVAARIATSDKDKWPDPLPAARGDEVSGEPPRFTIEHA
jgi:hypothetical protein